MYVCTGGIVIIRWEMPPTQKTPDDQGGWAGQPGSLYTGGRVASQAGSLPGGGTRRVLLDMTNPPRGTGPGL